MSDDLRDLYTSLDGLALADLVRRREVSAVEVLDTAVAAIESINPEINAVIDRTYDYGRRQIAAGLPAGPFEGVPFLLKELATLVAGLKQTNACPYLRDYVATLDMETVVRQKRAGFVIVGKTNAPENGWSLTTEPAMFGPTRNPWRSDVTPGGSSGGAGAAVAARFVPIAEASDAAGSIRVPASNNGLVGLKPSRGRMTVAPAYGDVFFGCAHFLCVSRTVRDTAAYLDAIGGVVPGDPYTAPLPERPFLQEVTTQPDRLRIGFTRAAPDGQQLPSRCCRGGGRRGIAPGRVRPQRRGARPHLRLFDDVVGVHGHHRRADGFCIRSRRYLCRPSGEARRGLGNHLGDDRAWACRQRHRSHPGRR